jgi:hypothetical protein
MAPSLAKEVKTMKIISPSKPPLHQNLLDKLNPNRKNTLGSLKPPNT